MNRQEVIRKREKPVISYSINGVQMFLLTKNAAGTYTMYEGEDDNLKRLGKGDNPIELERKFKVTERLKERAEYGDEEF